MISTYLTTVQTVAMALLHITCMCEHVVLYSVVCVCIHTYIYNVCIVCQSFSIQLLSISCLPYPNDDLYQTSEHQISL